MTTNPLRVIVAGGGVAGIEALLTLRALAGDRCDLTLIDPAPEYVHRPLMVAEPFARDRARRYPLATIARRIGAHLVQDGLACVDDAARVVLTEHGERLRYDALLLATGTRSLPAYRHAMTWDEASGNDRLGGLLADIEQGYTRRVAFVVPPGPGWPLPAYELALMTADQAWGEQMQPEITLVTSEVAPLAVFGPNATEAVEAELERAGIRWFAGAYADVEKGHAATVVVHPGMRRIEADRVVALPRLLGRAPQGVPADGRGFVEVDPHGRVPGLRRVWAAGDGTAFPVKFGGLAAAQAVAAAEAIADMAGADVVPRPFRPVLHGRLLLGRGELFLEHVAGGGAGGGTVTRDAPPGSPPDKVAAPLLVRFLAALDEEPADPPAGARWPAAASRVQTA